MPFLSASKSFVCALAILTTLPAILGTAHGDPPPASTCSYLGTEARCGVLIVPENRARPREREIELHYVVVSAKNRTGPPIFLLAGGPGQSAIVAASHGSPIFDTLRGGHDFVVLDQRGTGRSHPLDCLLYTDDASTLGEVFPLAAVRSCRDELAQSSDLNAYGSAAAADDINDLRRALGYDKILLYGGSYGTTEALVYIRRHGHTVAGALLEGVAPTFFRLPLPFPQGAQHALLDLTKACNNDSACHAAFPSFANEFQTMVDRSHAGIAVDYVNASHEHVQGAISHAVFADRMRQAMYSQDTAAVVPFVIHQAYQGDTTPLGKLVVLLSRSINGSLAIGENFSVDCAEDVAFISDTDVAAASAGSFMGDTIIRARQDVCAIWNVQPVDKSFLDPVHSHVPVLMLSGTDDPATPPQYAAEQLKYLPSGRQVLIANGVHDEDSPCLERLRQEFLDRHSTKNLDAECAAVNKRPPFATSLPNFLK